MDNDSSKYKVPASEDYEPGSNEGVLKNYLGIKKEKLIHDAEYQEYLKAQDLLSDSFDRSHKFTDQDICKIHKLWLGDIYPFAGKYRTVGMSKDGFPFAAPNLIPKLMKDFSDEYLSKYTPCNFQDLDDLSHALGVVHVELILIHPFREGNGRTARLFADLMALQAGKPQLIYTLIDQVQNKVGFEKYIKAIHAGHAGNYQPITDLFRRLIEDTLKKSGYL